MGNELLDALPHFSGRFVGEGDGQDLTGIDPEGFDEKGDSIGEHARLSTPGTREDQYRAFGALDRFPLGWIEIPK